MKIPKYWARGTYTAPNARGRPANFSCWHWSDISVEDARGQAVQRAQAMAAAFLGGQRLNRYAYGSRPIREEVVDVISKGAAELGLITRNAYGALVLNAARAMFVDIDFKPATAGASLSGALRGLVGKPPAPEAAYLPAIEQWVRRSPGLGARVYRTAAGLRCLVTSDTFDPAHPATLDLMQSLGGDPLYITLCRQQESFRARLTPKPWRCGATQPPSRFPWISPGQESAYRQWEAAYGRAAGGFAVCRLVGTYGDARLHPEIEPIVALHDQYCGVAGQLALA